MDRNDWTECPGISGRDQPEYAGKAYYERLVRKHGKGKALTVLAHKLARAVYHLWKHNHVFDQAKFLAT